MHSAATVTALKGLLSVNVSHFPLSAYLSNPYTAQYAILPKPVKILT